MNAVPIGTKVRIAVELIREWAARPDGTSDIAILSGISEPDRDGVQLLYFTRVDTPPERHR